jgi:lipoprotein-anchoring transpeptidase ErfK/SrfK
MAGGPGNRSARYVPQRLSKNDHGTNKPSSIGTHVSSGYTMLNEDVIDLYGRTSIGTKVWSCP